MSSLGDRRIQASLMRLLDAGRDFGDGRSPTIYIENHDHERFVLKAGGRSQWWRTQPYMIALFTSPGAVLMYNGQEFGEDRWMPEPGPPEKTTPVKRVEPRPLRWNFLQDEPGQQLHAFYQRLIQLRKDHPGLHSNHFHPSGWEEWRTGLDADGFGIDTDRQIVVYHRWGNADDGQLERFYVVLNFSDSPQWVDLQLADNGMWEDLLSGWRPRIDNYRLGLEVGSQWGHVFYRKG